MLKNVMEEVKNLSMEKQDLILTVMINEDENLLKELNKTMVKYYIDNGYGGQLETSAEGTSRSAYDVFNYNFISTDAIAFIIDDETRMVISKDEEKY